MIIDKEVEIVINPSNYKKLKNFGYKFKGVGDRIIIKIEHLNLNSHNEILCSCDYCGDIKKIKYQNYLKYIKNDGKYTCKICNLEKRKRSCLEKYGVENVSQNKDIKRKIINTMKENGTQFFWTNREKHIEKMIKLYGVDYISKNKNIKEKIKKTNLERYGVENVLLNKDIKNKIKKTIFERYGVENVSQNEDIHRKQHNGYITKYHSGFYYRGTYEKHFIDFCLENNIDVENFKGTIKYVFENKNKRYFPDFYIPSLNLVVEIKSDYTYEIEKEQNLAKKEASINKGFNFIFVIDKNYDEIKKKV